MRPLHPADRVNILSVVGTRPQLIKVAALQAALRARHREVFVDTGQHYDPVLAGDLFLELGLAAPDYSLGIAGGEHGAQTGRMLIALEPILLAERPDAVLVYGDTNSTLAGALVAAKMGIPVAHVEAGLRSFDRRMPEELNRVLVDHLARWCFAPTPAAEANLAAEGVRDGVVRVGDLMQDLAARVAGEVRDPSVLDGIGEGIAARSGAAGLARLRPGCYLFATIHRAENREPEAIGAWTALLSGAASPERPVILPIHPGTRIALERLGAAPGPDVVVVDPLGYRSALALQLHAAAILTDSGGVQREAAWLDTPCLVLRRSTEWLELMDASRGRMVLVGLDRRRAMEELERLAPVPDAESLAAARARDLVLPPSGAAERIAAVLAGDA